MCGRNQHNIVKQLSSSLFLARKHFGKEFTFSFVPSPGLKKLFYYKRVGFFFSFLSYKNPSCHSFSLFPLSCEFPSFQSSSLVYVWDWVDKKKPLISLFASPSPHIGLVQILHFVVRLPTDRLRQEGSLQICGMRNMFVSITKGEQHRAPHTEFQTVDTYCLTGLKA